MLRCRKKLPHVSPSPQRTGLAWALPPREQDCSVALAGGRTSLGNQMMQVGDHFANRKADFVAVEAVSK